MADLLYGLRKIDGKIIYIDDIPLDKKQRHTEEWECVCPYCHIPLVAKKGNEREYHFAHKSGLEPCSIEYATQSALHLLAKEIIAEEQKVYLPNVYISCDEAGVQNIPTFIKNMIPKYKFWTGKVISCNSVTLENRISNFVPDLVFRSDKSTLPYLIEIYVTHKVDKEKIEKVKQVNLPMLEIDLSSYFYEGIDKEKLTQIITTENEYIRWIYYPSDEAITRARTYYLSHTIIQNYLREKKEKKQKRMIGEAALKNLLIPENYKTELLSYRNDSSFQNLANSFLFYREHKEIPFFIDIPITGEIIFQCDRRIWQGRIFDRYIYNRAKNFAKKQIEDIFDDLRNDHHIPVNEALLIDLKIDTPERKTYDLQWDVVYQYMKYMSYLGFVKLEESHSGIWATVLKNHAIEPPRYFAAKRFNEILQSVDKFNPYIDAEIDLSLLKYNKNNLHWSNDHYDNSLPKTYSVANLCSSKEERRKQVENMAFEESDVLIKDSLGIRWFRCKECNQIYEESDMSSYWFNLNIGICRYCMGRLSKEEK